MEVPDRVLFDFLSYFFTPLKCGSSNDLFDLYRDDKKIQENKRLEEEEEDREINKRLLEKRGNIIPYKGLFRIYGNQGIDQRSIFLADYHLDPSKRATQK
jgi:hypothetical protein